MGRAWAGPNAISLRFASTAHDLGTKFLLRLLCRLSFGLDLGSAFFDQLDDVIDHIIVADFVILLAGPINHAMTTAAACKADIGHQLPETSNPSI